MFGNVLRKAAGTVGKAGSAYLNQNPVAKAVARTVAPNLTLFSSLQNYGGNPGKPFALVPAAKAGDQSSYPQLNSSGQVLGAGTTNWSQYQSTYDPYRGSQSTQGFPNPTISGNNFGGGGAPSGDQGGATGGDNGSYDPFGALRQAYQYARGLYEQQMPGLESDYNYVKGDVEGAIKRAKETLGESKQNIEVGYGRNLRDLLTRGQELGQKTRNTYSGLNALDSSSYADEQTKQGQALFDAQTQLGTTREGNLKEADRQYADYETKATGYLNELGKQYLSGKQALQQAIADNNIEEANTILGWLQNMGSTIANAKVQLAGLQASGTDVVGSLKKLNGAGLDSIFGNYLTKMYNPGIANLSSVGAPQISGSGYISPRTGKRYSTYQDFLASEG